MSSEITKNFYKDLTPCPYCHKAIGVHKVSRNLLGLPIYACPEVPIKTALLFDNKGKSITIEGIIK